MWSCKFRIYPTEEQKVFLAKHFGSVRFIYNYTLSRSNEVYEKEKRTIHINDLKKELPLLKVDKAWLKEINSQSLQEAMLNFDKSRNSFLKGKSGKPRLKKKNAKQSFFIPQHFSIKISKRGNYFLMIPKLKMGIRANIHRELIGKAKRVVITKTTTGKYFASISCEVKREEIGKRSGSGEIGIDLGLTNFVTTSDGKKIKSPSFLYASLKKIVMLSRSVSRKEVGSKNREKEKLKLARVYEEVFNERSAFVHETSFVLINENQVVYAEDLCVMCMIET